MVRLKNLIGIFLNKYNKIIKEMPKHNTAMAGFGKALVEHYSKNLREKQKKTIMKPTVLFNGGMGEFPINGWLIVEKDEETLIHIDPQVICMDRIVIRIPHIELLNTNNCINITIKGQYPTIIVDIYIMGEYEDSHYTFCGYNSGAVGFLDGSFTDEYKCTLQNEDYTEALPF